MKISFRDRAYNACKKFSDIKKYEGKIYLNCCVGVEYDLDLLEYSIDYYKELGVDEFFIILNTIDENSSNLKEATNILDKYSNIHKSIWIGEYFSKWTAQKNKDFIKDYVRDNDWVITIDIDEFQDYPMGLRELITICEKRNYHCVIGKLIDRISKDGKLKPIDKNRSLWEQYSINTNLFNKHYFVNDKVLLRKKYITLHPGHHFPVPGISDILVYPEMLNVDHFRWRENLRQKLDDRMRIWQKLGQRNCSLIKKMFDYYDEQGTLL